MLGVLHWCSCSYMYVYVPGVLFVLLENQANVPFVVLFINTSDEKNLCSE